MNEESADAAQAGIEELCRHAVTLIQAARGPLKSVRVRAGDLVVEVEWPEAAPARNGHSALDGQPLTLSRTEHAVLDEPPAGQPEDDGSFVVHAPLVGTFYRASAPGARPFADVGDEVAAGQQVAIVEAMKLLNAVDVDRAGRIVDVLVSDGTPVEYGEALFVLVPV